MPDQDWAADTADRIDHVAAVIRSKTSDRLVGVARLVVYGLLAAVMGTMAVILLLIAAIRFLDAYIPRGVWIPYMALGAIFVVGGLFLWSKRTAKTVET